MPTLPARSGMFRRPPERMPPREPSNPTLDAVLTLTAMMVDFMSDTNNKLAALEAAESNTESLVAQMLAQLKADSAQIDNLTAELASTAPDDSAAIADVTSRLVAANASLQAALSSASGTSTTGTATVTGGDASSTVGSSTVTAPATPAPGVDPAAGNQATVPATDPAMSNDPTGASAGGTVTPSIGATGGAVAQADAAGVTADAPVAGDPATPATAATEQSLAGGIATVDPVAAQVPGAEVLAKARR